MALNASDEKFIRVWWESEDMASVCEALKDEPEYAGKNGRSLTQAVQARATAFRGVGIEMQYFATKPKKQPKKIKTPSPQDAAKFMKSLGITADQKKKAKEEQEKRAEAAKAAKEAKEAAKEADDAPADDPSGN